MENTNDIPSNSGHQITNEEKINEQFNQQFSRQFGGSGGGQKEVPNATAVLVLGIISIVGCFCYGVIGIITGIVALILANNGNVQYNQDPSLYTQASYKNLRAGRICAIIGLSISILYLLAIIILISVGLSASAPFWNAMH